MRRVRPGGRARRPDVTATVGGVVHLDHTVERGGAELALVRVLKARSWQATVIVPRSSQGAGIYADLSDSDVQVEQRGPSQPPGLASNQTIAALFRLGRSLVGQPLSLWASKAFRDAAVVHANTSRSTVFGAAACALSRRKRFVVHLRDNVDAKSLGKVGLLAMRIALKRADGVIANSNSTLESASPYLRHKTRRTVIASPIGLPEKSDAAPIREQVTTIGMLARLDPWKGQAQLIRAFATAFGHDTDVRLELAGSAEFGKHEFHEELKELASSLGIAQRVHFLGHVAEIYPLLSSWDICVHASTRPEPLGQNVLQYLAIGAVVVASDGGGPREWINHRVNGLLTPMGDEAKLAEALVELSSDGEFRRRLSAAAIHTEGLLSDEQVAALTRNFYEDVA